MDNVTNIVNEVSKNLLLNKLAAESKSTTDLAKTGTNPHVIRNTLGLPNIMSKNITLDVNGNEEARKQILHEERNEKRKKVSHSKSEAEVCCYFHIGGWEEGILKD